MNKLRYLSVLLFLTLLITACQPAPPPATATTTQPPTATNVPAPTTTPTTPPPTATLTPLPTPTLSNPAAGREAAPISPVGADGTLPPGTDDFPWWDDTVFYEVFVRSFYDSDGDGVGDLAGLISQLDYLNDGNPATTDDLGVTGLWLMPIQQSPSYHGYDVVDYYAVDDEYGSNEDFLRLVAAAHARGMRVIIDLVLNHTSSQHPWFQQSRDPASDKRDWYVWAEEPGQHGWQKTADGYYYALFWEGMPDLNYENPAVTAEMYEVIRFWLDDMGADGFRLDAIKHLIEEGDVVENTPGTHAWLADFYDYYKGLNPDAFTVGEVWSNSQAIRPYLDAELDSAFEFNLAETFLGSALSGRSTTLSITEASVVDIYPAGQYSTFLSNHDQTRARSQLFNDEQAKVAATLQLTFPGVPFIYYGEEIGMQGAKPDENLRRPLQWTVEGGFTTGTPWRGYHDDLAERNVVVQETAPDSVFNHYRALIRLRNEHEALRIGAWQALPTAQRSVFATLRTSDEETLLVLVNLSGKPVEDYALTLPAGHFVAGTQPALLLGEGALNAPVINAQGGCDVYVPVPQLAAYGSYILQFE
ncbi:MAG: alpha-amylase family glycosyl hydrolase [Chloroflexota bacterium]|nr:alpha-amylase family glycosyl hydrolase [Chloroflexota bacterium]